MESTPRVEEGPATKIEKNRDGNGKHKEEKDFSKEFWKFCYTGAVSFRFCVHYSFNESMREKEP